MTELLLNPTVFQAGIVVLAILTPLVALAGRRMGWKLGHRLTLLVGALGPFALVFWGFHNLILATVGFDRMWSVVIILSVAGVVGFLAGRWAAADPG